MTIVKHELRQGIISFLIWTAAIAFMMAVCVFVFPEMKAQMAAMNLIANTAKSAAFLKNITPFGYCDGAEIVSSGGLDTGKIAIGLTIGIICIIAAYIKYGKKDIQ